MKQLRAILAFLLGGVFPAALADFQYLPDVPDYSVVRGFRDVFYQHFRSRQLTVSAIPSYSQSDFESFRVTVAGREYFVRLYRADCSGCAELRFDQEWLLKKNIKTEARLTDLNIHRVLPEASVTFVYQRKQYLLSRFSQVSAVSLSEFYRQAQFASPFSLSFKQKKILSRLFFRLGQAVAVFSLDPSVPSAHSRDILQRDVKIRLPRRNSRNQLYDPATDTLFFTEWVPNESEALQHQNVEALLQQWLSSFVEMVNRLTVEKSFHCGEESECITEPFYQFVSGFQSMLPSYEPQLLTNVLSTILKEQLHHRCGVAEDKAAFCEANSQVRVSRFFRFK